MPRIATAAAALALVAAATPVQQAKLTADDGVDNDALGTSVAVDGDTSITGAPWANAEKGAAYVFTRDPSTGTWTQQDKLTATDGVRFDFFGGSVAVAGDTAIVGAFEKDGSTGAAYVFTRDPSTGTWTQQAKLTATDGTTGDGFGSGVALDGDTAIAGAPGDDISTGAAYVFTRDPSTGTWTQQAKLTATDGAPGDRFGVAVAMDGDTAIAGARGDDDGGDAAGALYVFTRDPSTGTWAQRAKLTADDAAPDDQLGTAAGVDGDTAIVGAYDKDSRTGAAYVFTRDPSTDTWAQRAKLTAGADATTGQDFGYAVAVDGDTSIAGARGDDDDTGAAYVFVVDTTPPVLSLPGDITVDTEDGAGAVVTYSATADDATDGDLEPDCNPASGSTFPVGTTTVTCTATDTAGNSATGTFDVTVTPAGDDAGGPGDGSADADDTTDGSADPQDGAAAELADTGGGTAALAVLAAAAAIARRRRD